MTETSPSSTKNQTSSPDLSRRKALNGIGLMALGIAPLNLRAAPESVKSAPECLQFASVNAMKQAGNLKPGTLCQTFGYHMPGDGGAALYRVIRKSQDPPPAGSVSLNQSINAELLAQGRVNYAMFGARGDGESPDGPALMQAHIFANQHRIPVENLSGTYKIDTTRGIPIETPVNWGQSAFYINESFNTKAPLFHVRSTHSSVKPEFTQEEKKEILAALKPGTQRIEALKTYRNCLMYVQDSGRRIGRRAGARYNGQDRAMQELLYLEEDGRIIGDIAWKFQDFTSLELIPAEESYLEIQGGSFYLSGDNHPEPEKKGYFQNGISVTRSRTIIRNQWVGLQAGKTDIAYNPRNGFYNFNRVYDILLENIRLIPWEQDRPGKEKDLYAGTYGIGGNRMLKTTFRNITAEGTLLHWGVFGTNMNKDFRIENCQLNRVDVHFHCWNLHIMNSHIGQRGITVTGGGNLCIENTTCAHANLVNFRYDYGGKWDGDIYIRNCRLTPGKNSEVCLLRFYAADWDYGYPVGPARDIQVEGVTVDYSGAPGNQKPAWLMHVSRYSKAQHGARQFFPTRVRFERIHVKGRTRGFLLTDLPDPAGYDLDRETKAPDERVETNARLRFIDIDTDQSAINEPHFKIARSVSEKTKNSLYPKLEFRNCQGLRLSLADSPCEVFAADCIVTALHTEEGFPGSLWFERCTFHPARSGTSEPAFIFSNPAGTTFSGCVFGLPEATTSSVQNLQGVMGAFEINGVVTGNHINSRLGPEILQYLHRTGQPLNPDFIRRLALNQDYGTIFLKS